MNMHNEHQAEGPTEIGSGDIRKKSGEMAESRSGNSSPGRGGWMALFFFILGLSGSLLVGWVAFPWLLYEKQNQPIQFNHALHMEQVTDGCESCHYFRDDGTFAGVPTLETCKQCHYDEPLGDDPGEKEFIDKYLSKDKEVPWLIYSKQPPCVFFSHAAHVKGAHMKCESCHGDYEHATKMRPYERNRISGYSRDIWGYSIARIGNGLPGGPKPMKMNDCAACHLRETGSKGACFQCHK